MKKLVRLISLVVLLAACPAHAVDLTQVEKELGTAGAVGWIHGSSRELGLFVFTYRNPENFFDYIEMSLAPSKPEIRALLSSFGRHDKVLVKGSLLDNPSPQKHIDVTSIELVKRFENPYPAETYSYSGKIPETLLKTNMALFLVHAVAEEGHILVVEYQDVVIPIFSRDNTLTKGLSRNDIVRLQFKVQKHPDQPLHLRIDGAATEPLKIVEPISGIHGKAGSVEGALVLFPQSPGIRFNVFAVQQELQEGLKRQYTLINFDDSQVFAQIREALQKAWDRHPGKYVNGRNKRVSTAIRVRATGVFNEVDPNQANPQIILKSLDSLQIIESGR